MFYDWKRVDINILVVCDARDIAGYDRSTLELSNAPLHIKQDTTSTPVHQYTSIPVFQYTNIEKKTLFLSNIDFTDFTDFTDLPAFRISLASNPKDSGSTCRYLNLHFIPATSSS